MKKGVIEERYIRRNTTEPFNLTIAKEYVKGHSGVHKFGATPAMSQNQTGTIWDVNDTLYPWSVFETPGVLNIPVVNVGDNGSSITIYGLDSDFNDVSETLTLSSATTTTGSQVFSRVYRAFYLGSETNTDNIDVKLGTTTVLRITSSEAQTLMSIYTVPAGYTAYLTKGVSTCQASADMTVSMFVRYFGQDSFRIGHTAEVSGAGGQYTYDFTVPIAIPEKSDIDVRASVRSNNARVTASFDLILVKNDAFQ